ncbi:MAG: aspartate kinase [Eubacteriales bacterium]
MVVKFGGTSLADADQFKRVADIIKSDKSRRYVVPSAPGKRFDGDAKVTDMLYACYDLASKGEDIDESFDNIKKRYNDIIIGLGMSLSLDVEFAKIKSGLKNKAGRDYAASRGEYLNGLILAEYLGFSFIDAGEVVFFNENGSFNAEMTNIVMQDKLSRCEYAVIPGFYGSMPNGTVKTFSRGGSDITGALVARAAGAVLYENWTDVSGFCMADPRIIKNPKYIGTITYRELRELSYMGATVLHEDSIFPVRIAGIPIAIKNTNEPDAPGTRIVAYTNNPTGEDIITGIAGKKGFAVLTLEKDMMNAETGFIKRVLEIMEMFDISFEHLPSGIDTLSVVVNQSQIESKKDFVFNALQEKVNPDSIEYQSALSLIAVVGRGMIKTKGTAARVFGAVARAGVNIRMIDQGSSELNIIIGVNDNDFEKAMKAIYEEFVRN